jgi:transposase
MGRPTALLLTPGPARDLTGFDALAETISSDVLIADKGDDADKRVLRRASAPVRAVLAKAGKTAVMPPRRNRKSPAFYDKELYKKRHRIENFFSRLKDFRAIATRYEKSARNFLAGVYLAAAIIWLD